MNLMELHDIFHEALAANRGLIAVAAIVGFMGLIEISPIQLNPWSRLKKILNAILRWFGNAINAKVIEDLAAVKAQQQATQERLEEHIRIDDEHDAKNTRKSILRFNADLIDGKNFTHEYFVDMLSEIDEYETYCHSHEKFKNGRAVMAIANIKRVFEEHERDNDFA